MVTAKSVECRTTAAELWAGLGLSKAGVGDGNWDAWTRRARGATEAQGRLGNSWAWDSAWYGHWWPTMTEGFENERK